MNSYQKCVIGFFTLGLIVLGVTKVEAQSISTSGQFMTHQET